MVLLALPWLNPWAPLPVANTVPLLVSWACLALVLLLAKGLCVRDVVLSWVLAALISSVIGWAQYFGWAQVFSPWVHVPDHLGEAMGNLRQRNQLATSLGIGMVAVLYWRTQGLAVRHAMWMLALLATGNAATSSRTGLLHMVLVLAFAVLWSQRQAQGQQRWSWRLALWAGGIYLFSSWALPATLSLLSGQDALSALVRMGQHDGCGSRRLLWSNVLDLIAQKPWSGWGWGELKYAHYMTDYTGDRFCDILGNAHNLPLHLAVTLGVPLTVFLLMAFVTWVLWMRPWKTRRPHEQLAWAVLALIGLHSLLEFPLWYGPFQLAVVLSLAWLVRSESSGVLVWSRSLRTGAGVVLAIACLMAVDYARVRQIYVPPAARLPLWRERPLEAAKESWFFTETAAFAELTLTPVTADNAHWAFSTSQALVHYSPEPRVVQSLIQSAQILGHNELASEHQQRLRRAFPAQP